MSVKNYSRVMVVTLLILSTINIKSSYAQQIQFARTYPIANIATAYSFVQLKDSGFLMVGEYGVPGNSYRAVMLRINKYGDTLWTKKFPGLAEMYDVIMWDDTTVLVTGSNSPITVIKYNIDGDSLGSYSYNVTVNDASARIFKTKVTVIYCLTQLHLIAF